MELGNSLLLLQLTFSIILSMKRVAGYATPEEMNKTVSVMHLHEYTSGNNLTRAIRDIALGLPTSHITLLFDTLSDIIFPEVMIKKLQEVGITTSIFLINNEKSQENFCEYTKETLITYEDSTVLIFASRSIAVDLFWLIQQRDLIHRKLLYVFYWGRQSIDTSFTTDHFEAMRLALITNPRPGTYRVYYSQGEASGNNELTLVNWWSAETGLFRKPVLVSPQRVYQDFKGRVFEVPVLHKPPWNFVEYANDSFKVDGGRDDKLLTVIAEKLNFRYRYIDPPERNQGTAISKNGSFPGVLGQVWQRNFDFFMGDVTITYERSKAVEFSFFTLVDSEAFVTHKPSKLNEAFALIRPFQWQVWPTIITTIIVYGPILFAIIEAPSIWKKRPRTNRERKKLFYDCIWFSTSTFLRQAAGKQPGNSHKIRLVFTITTLGATYVIGDMYSANLTSLLARPGREKPITVLEELEMAMKFRGYELLVEKHSSSLSTLQNGTGIYKRLWNKMQTQPQYVIESVENGMKLVRERKNFAVLGGRETLYFDSKRFGSHNFHISEKLNTKYSAIAMQLGCPYVENFNRIIMQLFEGGILTKMTEEEYEKLGEKQRAAAGLGETDEQIAEAQEELMKKGESTASRELDKGEEEITSVLGFDSDHLQPLSLRMLQGAFYILLIGYCLSVAILIIEKNVSNCKQLLNSKKCYKCKAFCRVCNCSKWRLMILKCYFKWVIDPMREMMHYMDDEEERRVAGM